MKKYHKFSSLLLLFCFSVALSAQTNVTLTFTYNQPQPTSPAPNLGIKNVYAVWIEDAAGIFIKTKARYVSTSTDDHLPTGVLKVVASLLQRLLQLVTIVM